MEENESFLTDRQMKVLELRAKGLSQAEVAQELETSRANICSLEKRAERNIERAKRTLKMAKRARAPVRVTIEINEDILESVKKFFSRADEAGIHVSLDTPELISKLRDEAGDRLEGRKASEEIELNLNPQGDVLIF